MAKIIKNKKYTRNVGRKFNEDGTAKEFPGNTIICHVPKQSPQFQYLLKLRETLMSQHWSKKYSFLPPSSFHMTVFEGVCDQVRKNSKWTSMLSLDAPLEEVDEFLISKWDSIEKPSYFNMKAKLVGIGGVIGIQLTPKDDAMNEFIRNFRNVLSETYGIRMHLHSLYHFHISYAYAIEKISIKERLQAIKFMKKISQNIEEEFGILETGTPELTFFSDMFEFAHSRAEANRKIA